jgi:hypothetical protein
MWPDRLRRTGWPAGNLLRVTPGLRDLSGSGPGGVRVQPATHIIGDKVDDDPARTAVQVPEDALPVAQAAQDGLMFLRGIHAEQ